MRSGNRELRWPSDLWEDGRLRFDQEISIGAAPLGAAIAIRQGLRLSAVHWISGGINGGENHRRGSTINAGPLDRL